MSEEKRHNLIPPAFLFWLENAQSNSTESISFDKLCRELGIIETPKRPQKNNKEEAKKAIQRAEKIVELDKKRQSR